VSVEFEIQKYNFYERIFSEFIDRMTICSLNNYEIRKCASKYILFDKFIDSLDVVESFIEKQSIVGIHHGSK
jgi:hypothetical protein